MRILFIGDISASSGRRVVSRFLPDLRAQYDLDFVIANGENAAGGLGITQATAHELFNTGIDVITLGNHAFSKKDALEYIAKEPHLLRPANFPPGNPGRGWDIYYTEEGNPVAVVNLVGRTFMHPADCPFRTADQVISEVSGKADVIIVDMHAEATSEKMALGWYLNGRVSAVVGTHTHIQTSDERVLADGTAYITDVGMTGVHDSVLGLDKEIVIERFKTGLLGKFTLAEGNATLQAVLIETDPVNGKAESVKRINISEDH